MPDELWDLEAVRAQQAQARAQALQDLDPAPPDPTERPAHLHPRAIADCGLCDDQGYRGTSVCTHRDHAAETQHGRALMRAELDKIRRRQTQRARGTTTP